jgi:hypothetical protein
MPFFAAWLRFTHNKSLRSIRYFSAECAPLPTPFKPLG